MPETSARVLRNVKSLHPLYEKLILKKELSLSEQSALLKIAVLLLNDKNSNAQALGYRIIVLYSNHLNDYVPLYDVALNKGYIPISKMLEGTEAFRDKTDTGFFNCLHSSLSEIYRFGDIYQTEEQLKLNNFFREQSSANVVVIAPTSYGKSELFVSFCNNNVSQNICIVVPTKALLAQTKRRVLEGISSHDERRIITHPEMYVTGGGQVIAILTQERLLRLFQTHEDLVFDHVFVDEAHNLLGDDIRSLLLAKVIVLLKDRYEDVTFKYLTPFLVDTKNISARYIDATVEEFKVHESVKTEKYYIIDFRKDKKLRLYDQFFDKYSTFEDGVYADEVSFIEKHAAPKNIIYLNTPSQVESFAREIIKGLPLIEDESIKRLCRTISEYMHGDYLLIDCLERGVVYHHGSVPDIVKLYAESIYSNEGSLKHIVTTSTLLEGVNIPAQKLFLLSIKKGNRNLTKSQFRNLVGRTCRFKEVFDYENGDLSMLEPETYILGTEKYIASAANLENFIKNHAQVDLSIQDEVENVLLERADINDKNSDQKKDADEFLENLSEGITGENVSYASTAIGKLCFLNNISEVDILLNEAAMTEVAERFSEASIKEPLEVLYAISIIFIPFLKEEGDAEVFRRLREDSARKFYSMFLNWRMRNASYSEMINRFLSYWEGIENTIIYVSHRWGEITRGEGWRKNWTDISQKRMKERVNLAIVRIKEEQDFVDNIILKYIEVLNDLGKLDQDLYLKIKYGTTNRKIIALINSGINSHLAAKLISDYASYVDIDLTRNAVTLNHDLIEKMKGNDENEILIFEARFHVR